MTDTVAAAPGGADAATPPGGGPSEAPGHRTGPAGPPGGEPAEVRGRRPRRRLRLLLVFAVLVGAVVYLLVEGLGSSLDYFDTVPQALVGKASIGTKVIRLEGVVVPGSVRRTASGADFEISGGGRTIAVRNTGSPPQLFQPDIPVVVVGHFGSPASDLFLSDQIMVKHSATYIAKHPNRVRAPDGAVH